MAFLKAEGPGGNDKSGRYYFGPNTKYGGFEVNQYCQMDSNNVITLDMYNQEYGGQVHQFGCNVNNYRKVNGAYAPMNDAHYFGQRVFDMYTEWLNTRPIRQKLTMRVHYGSNVGNAFWDGQQMTFGDGNQSMHPLATWDVISHEVSHGFTEQHSNLEYRGMSGGMNESFSDVSAAAFSQYIHGSFNWKMGEHVMKYDESMRYFIDPSRDGWSIGHISQYYNGMDVHNSSGIFNKAFYHLATSENWDIKQAFMAYATANQLYWSPYSSFQQGADGVCKAAQTLGYDSTAVGNAFAQVGIRTQDCSSSQQPKPNPKPEPQSDPDTSVLEMDIAVTIKTGAADEQHYILKSLPTQQAWVQTYSGTGDVNLYVAIDRPASINDYDCISASADNEEYCGFGGIQGADVHVMVKGAKSAADVYLKIGGDLSRTEPESQPDPKPQDTCLGLPSWSPMYYYPVGSQVQYYGNRFTALYDNWEEDPYYSDFVWNYEDFCN